MPETWSELIELKYGSFTNSERKEAWETAKQILHPGQWIEGKVIATAPFGIWVDFGYPIPGLLLITRLDPLLQTHEGVESLPQPGTHLRSCLIGFNEEQKTLVLSQNPNEKL